MIKLISIMGDFIDNILGLRYWEIMTDIHGGLAMLSLILFGSTIVLILSIDKFSSAVRWLKTSLTGLFSTVVFLNFMGLFVYRPYREKVPTSPRSILKSSPETDWLHSIVFEHKEFLALVPMILLLVATIITYKQGNSLKNNALLKRLLLFCVVMALIYVLVVATEAVLVTKTAPL